ncbi:MAG: hypothetical protein ACFCVH_05250 [Alphaproteobacteria bacterium]
MTAAAATVVLERFPEHAALIRRLMVSNIGFRAICDDYAVAAAALRHWEAMSGELSEERQVEYRALVDGLEHEILDALGRHGPEAAPASAGKLQ